VIDGAEAGRHGLVNHVVDQNDDGDAAFHHAVEIARQIISNVSCCSRLVDRHLYCQIEFHLFVVNFFLIFVS